MHTATMPIPIIPITPIIPIIFFKKTGEGTAADAAMPSLMVG